MSRFLVGAVEDVNVGSAEERYHADLTTDRTVLGQGEVATVFGMNFANSSGSAAEITVRDVAGGVRYTATMAARQSHAWPVKWFSDGDGLVVEGLTGSQADDVFVSVFYTGGVV